MPRLLLINPNTSESVTATLGNAASRTYGDSVEVICVTAPFGAPYITGEHSLAIAAHATLEARSRYLASGPTIQGCLIACFGDPALQALEELGEEPVIGLAEASMRAAAKRGPFAIVTGGHGWKEPLRRLAFSIGLLDHLVSIETVEASGAQLAADPAWANEILGGACLAALKPGQPLMTDRKPASIIVGGAGLMGFAGRLQDSVPVPLLDSVQCGLEAAAERLGITLDRTASASASA